MREATEKLVKSITNALYCFSVAKNVNFSSYCFCKYAYDSWIVITKVNYVIIMPLQMTLNFIVMHVYICTCYTKQWIDFVINWKTTRLSIVFIIKFLNEFFFLNINVIKHYTISSLLCDWKVNPEPLSTVLLCSI